MDGWLILFVAVEALGLLIAIAWWRDSSLPIPARPRSQHIFRLVKRDERAVYARIMRRTLAVQMRDMSRAMAKAAREIGKQLLPVFQRLSAALSAALDRR